MARNAVGIFAASLVGSALLLGPSAGMAEEYPNNSVRLVVPFGTGGGIDLVFRLVSQAMSTDWHQQVVVDNRPGADGDLGAAIVVHAKPDGYTLLGTAVGIAANAGIHPSRPFNAEKDLTPIMQIVSVGNVMFAAPDLHANSVADVIKAAKAQPGKLNYASQGPGASSFLAMELFKLQAGIDVVDIPFTDYGQQQSALYASQVAMEIVSEPQGVGIIASGKVKPLATTGQRRSAALPDVPTMQEAGVPGYEASTWYAVFGPPGMPKEIVDRISAELKAALNEPTVSAKLKSLNITVVAGSPDNLRDYLHGEIAKWNKVIKASGMKTD